MNILVIDDDRNIHKYYESALMGIRQVKSVTCAATLDEVAKSLTAQPDIIFCDIYMDPIVGPDILRNYRPLIGKTPIVMMSCSDDLQKITDELIDEGFDVVECFEKPVTPLMLHELLGK